MEIGKPRAAHGDAPAAAHPPAPWRRFLTRHTTALHWVAAAVVVVALAVLMHAVPSERLVQWVQRWVDSLGNWGPVAFGLIYIVAVLLFIPGSILSLAAGAIYGLLLGTMIVWTAATLGAAISFLIARHVAREAVHRRVQRSPKLTAIDEAIGQQGWKIVALLRLSPAIPFSLQNYLYGVTAVRFWPCMLATWLAMLPGTFLYVYVGSLGRTAVAGETTAAQWAVRGIGLIATVAVTLYVAKLAHSAVAQHTDINDADQQRAF